MRIQVSKLTYYGILSAAFVVVFVLGFLKFNKIIKVVDFSSINVEAENGLSKSKVQIKKGFYTINRENDAELFEANNGVIVFDGENDNLKTEYGENDFLIIYDNQLYFQFRNFVYNNNQSIDYNLRIWKENQDVWIETQIEPGGRSFKRKMSQIKDSHNLICNKPINPNNGIYDGIELH